MVKCTLCPSKLSKGKVCLICGKSYCLQESVIACPFQCKGEFSEFEIFEEKLGDDIIEWLFVKGLKIGLVDFEEIPQSLPAVLNSLNSEISQKYSMLLLPNRKSACKIINHFRRKNGFEDIEYDNSLDMSKYTLAEDFETKKEFILLNLGAISTNQMKFLMTFLSLAFSNIDVYRKANNGRITEAICTSIFNYEKRLGLPFVFIDTELEDLINNWSIILPGIYSEYEAIIKMTESFPQEIPEFIRQKIRQLESALNPDYLGWLDNIFDFIGAQIQVASVIAASMEEAHLKSYVDQYFNKINEVFESRLAGFPDLVLCSRIIIQSLSDKKNYASYETYQKNVALVILKAFEVILPKTLRTSEIHKLYEISQKYESLIEEGLPPIAPKLGTFTEFNTFLLQLFQRKTLLPEFRIIVGQILQGNLCFKIWLQSDYLSYLQGLDITTTVAKLIVDNFPDIKKRFGKETSCITLGYHDACLALLMFSQFASVLNDEATEHLLIQKSKKIAWQYNVSTIKILYRWREFTQTHDYSKLLELMNLYSDKELAEHSYLESQVKTIMAITNAIFKKKNFEEEFLIAENQALDIAVPATPKNVSFSYTTKSVINGLIFCHMVHIFQSLMIAYQVEGPSVSCALKNAFLNAKAMRIYLSPKDPLCNFVYKTEVISSLFIDDEQKTRKACANLLKSSHDAPMIKLFVERIEKWLIESARLKQRRFLVTESSEINENDPWERMLTKIISERKKEDFEKSIASSQAFVFVEGPCDIAVFDQFATKLVPEKQIIFMDIEGFPNMENYAQARITKRISVPVYMLLDGDVLTDLKKKKVIDKLIKKIDLPKERIIYLSKHSIENYLLIPHAIKVAFPQNLMNEKDIAEFIKKNHNKRDKKQALNNLFSKLQIGSYSPEKACAIASKIEVTEINQEIEDILQRV